VQIFSRMSRTRQPVGSHQIRVFHRRSEQLIGREARRELEEASAHVLGSKASPKAALTITKHQPRLLIVAGLLCRPPPIKVNLIEFPSSLWFCRSKPQQKPTTMARENQNSSESPRLAMARRHEREPAPPPNGGSRPNRLIGDERPRLEADIPFRLI
jgi:hypothetical protein